MTLIDRLLFMCSNENPDNLLSTFTGGLFTVFTIIFMCLFFFHSIGVIYCYLIGFKSCNASPYMIHGSYVFMLLIIPLIIICYILFKGLIIIYNDIKSAFKTNEEIEKLKTK
jgi:hypothetical protein